MGPASACLHAHLSSPSSAACPAMVSPGRRQPGSYFSSWGPRTLGTPSRSVESGPTLRPRGERVCLRTHSWQMAELPEGCLALPVALTGTIFDILGPSFSFLCFCSWVRQHGSLLSSPDPQPPEGFVNGLLLPTQLLQSLSIQG